MSMREEMLSTCPPGVRQWVEHIVVNQELKLLDLHQETINDGIQADGMMAAHAGPHMAAIVHCSDGLHVQVFVKCNNEWGIE